MSISEKGRSAKHPATISISMKAKEMKRSGKDVIILSAGEPDFMTPENIRQAAIRAMEEGQTKYTPTPGIPELREAVAEKFQRDNGLNYSPSQVLVSCGAKHAIFTTFQALLDPGDEVIIPTPFWASYPQQVEICEGVVHMVKPADSSLKVMPEELERAITPRTKIFILNTPCNPSGVVYTREELAALGEVLEEKGIYILSDEIYEKIIYDGNEHVSIAVLSDKLFEQTITINGVSKSYAMTGWRVG